MFGCTYWIRDDRVSKTGGTSKAKENTEKSKKTARVVRARDLQEQLSIDPAGLVLFAMLAGGDYDTKGLPGCGPSVTMLAVK
jgi:Holliday junction resolvase YEN1